MLPGAPENKRLEPVGDIGRFHVEEKLGFAPVLHCAGCGASIDTKAGRLAIGRFKLEHEECSSEASKQN